MRQKILVAFVRSLALFTATALPHVCVVIDLVEEELCDFSTGRLWLHDGR